MLFSISSAQTIDWVNLNPIISNTNPSFWQSIVKVDKNDNPVHISPINKKAIYGLSYIGDSEIIKRDPSGGIIWRDTIFGKVVIKALAVDASNNIYALFAFRDTLAAGGYMFIQSGSNFDYAIVKYNNSGIVQWAKKQNQIDPDIYIITTLTAGSGNGCWIGVIFTFPYNSSLIKLDDSGNIVDMFVQENVRGISSISVDNEDNVIVSGPVEGTNVSFNGYDTIPSNSYNEYVVKYNPAGIAQWILIIEDITFQDWYVTTDNSGNIYYNGTLFDSTYFGNIKANGPMFFYDFFVVKISPGGDVLWLKEIVQEEPLGEGQTGNLFPVACRDDAVFVTGTYKGGLNLGNGVTFSTAQFYDIFIIKYSSDGDALWGMKGSSSDYDQASSIAVDENGNIYFTGAVGADPDFGPSFSSGDYTNLFIAKITGDDVVPVELSYFTANVDEGKVVLNWKTISEINNKGFEIERKRYPVNSENKSDDLKDQNSLWHSIGFVGGSGTSTEPKHYLFIDKNVLNGKNIYRLKQIDFDGSFSYSNETEVEISIPEKFTLLQNFPNPFNPSTIISYQLPEKSNVTLKIYDVLGKEVAVLINNEWKEAGIHYYELNSSDFSFTSGVYIYNLRAGEFTSTKKFVLMR